MGKANDSIKYNRSYPEFNGTDEGMIQHKERSGAKAAALIPTTTFVASATAAMLLLLLALARIALVRPALLTVTTNSAQVEVRTDLEGSEDAYPLVYLLVPYEPGQRDPVTPGGRLRLSEQEVEALGDPVLQGEIYTRVEQLLFQGLDNRFDYLLLFCSEDENGELVLRREALYIRMVRIGDPDSPNRPGPIPDDSTPKGPLAIAITPAPATPAPDPATPPQTATSSATATATSSATATATSTATATPYDETTPYIPPTDDSTPTPVVPHGITILSSEGGQGLVGLSSDTLSAGPLKAKPGDTVYVGDEPVDDDEDHFVLKSWRIVSGDAERQGSGSFIMGEEDVVLEFDFVRIWSLTILPSDDGECTVLTSPLVTKNGKDYYEDDAAIQIKATPYNSTNKLDYFQVNSDSAGGNPLTINIQMDTTVQPVFAPRATCTIRLDYDVEIGDMSISGDSVSETGDYTYTCLEDTTVQLYANIYSDFSDEYRFDHFGVDDSNIGSSSPTSYTVKSDVTITAVFVPLWHWVILDHSPDYISANVWISPSDDVIEEGDGYLCREGAYVTLNAQATDDDEERYVLDHYEVNGSVISNPYLVSSSNVTVTAVFRDLYHTVTIEADPAGEVAAVMPTCGPFKQGETVSFNWWIKDGYSYRTYSITGGVTDESVTSTTCSFTMPDADVYVTIYFTEITYHSINVSGTEGCAGVSPSWRPDLAPGDSVNITWEAETGYEFSSWSVTGTDDYSLNSDKTGGTVVMGDADVNVTVYFDQKTHNVTVSVPEGGGTATLRNTNPVPVGDRVTITTTADTGYEFSCLIINGGDSTTDKSFTMPDEDVTVEVYFAHINYHITVNQEGGIGTVSDNPGNAAPGTPITITITGPDPGSGTTRLVDCTVSGVTATQTVTDIDDRTNQVVTITFDMPEADVTINASWTTLY